MGTKYSTGRGTRLQHSTAMEWKDMEKAKKKYDPVKHSTGETSTIKHATGTEFDYKVLSKQLEEEEATRLSGLRSKVRSKTTTKPDAYLEEFHKLTKNKRS